MEKEEFLEKFNNLTKGLYTIQSEYIDENTEIKIYHKTCTKTFKIKPKDLNNKTKYPYCSHNRKITTVEYKERVKRLTNGEYEFLDEYKNNCTKYKYKHNTCGHIFEMVPRNFNKGEKVHV